VQNPTSTDFTPPERSGDGDSQAESRATEIGRRAAAVLDEKRDAVARKIDSAASQLAERADSLPGGEKVANAAWATAEALENAAGYVRDQDIESMLSDLGKIVKKHPGATLLTVAALGFVLARAISRN